MKNNHRSLFWTGLVLLILSTLLLTACKSAEEVEQPARPSNAGGPGQAISLQGDAANGAPLFVANCQSCHGEQGKVSVANPGSKDGTVPPLNPIDSTLVNADQKLFATNIDLFMEHGSKPEGDNPALLMAAWGDNKTLTPQQIADVIAYVISLNSK